MNAKINDLMITSPITTVPHKSVGHVKEIMTKNGINSVPAVGPENELKGIVTSTDLLDIDNENAPVSSIMSTKVYTVPLYGDIHIAARIMRNHHIHHVVVTNEGKIEGVLSAFDLLKLVEDHRFVMKNPPTPSKKKSKRQ